MTRNFRKCLSMAKNMGIVAIKDNPGGQGCLVLGVLDGEQYYVVLQSSPTADRIVNAMAKNLLYQMGCK